MLKDHGQSEFGVAGILLVNIFLISEVAYVQLTAGFLGNGAFGPWSAVAVPLLTVLAMKLLLLSLNVYSSQIEQVQ